MSLNPFGKDIPMSLGDLQTEMNRMFDRVWHGGISTGPLDGNAWAPAFDVLDEDDRIVLIAEVPGMEASDIELNFQNNQLTLKGHRLSPWSEETTGKLVRRERRYGAFSRTVELPAEIDDSAITATAKYGILTVTLPKIERDRGKSIEVNVAE